MDADQEELPDWERLLAAERHLEVLAQVLDRGDLADWRALYSLAKADARLRSRIRRIALTVPLPLPHFWLAALASLGEPVDWNAPVPDYFESSAI